MSDSDDGGNGDGIRNTPLTWHTLLAIALILGALALYLYRESQQETARYEQQQNQFASKTLAQAIAHCRALWLTTHSELAPVAFAWQAQRLDWYVLEGADNTSMRHFWCDGTGLSEGQRYAQVLLKQATPKGSKPSALRPGQSLVDRYTDFSDVGVVALEAAIDPSTGAVVERRWTGAGAAHLSGKQAETLAVLFGTVTVPGGLATGPYPPRGAPTGRVGATSAPSQWLQRPDAAFALLEKHVLSHQKIAELHLNTGEIRVTVVGPVEVVGQPTADFGALTFDEYAVADSDTFRPTTAVQSTCQRGRSLSDVKALFFAAAPDSNLLSASFNCAPKNGSGALGGWYLEKPSQRSNKR